MQPVEEVNQQVVVESSIITSVTSDHEEDDVDYGSKQNSVLRSILLKNDDQHDQQSPTHHTNTSSELSAQLSQHDEPITKNPDESINHSFNIELKEQLNGSGLQLSFEKSQLLLDSNEINLDKI